MIQFFHKEVFACIVKPHFLASYKTILEIQIRQELY